VYVTDVASMIFLVGGDDSDDEPHIKKFRKRVGGVAVVVPKRLVITPRQFEWFLLDWYKTNATRPFEMLGLTRKEIFAASSENFFRGDAFTKYSDIIVKDDPTCRALLYSAESTSTEEERTVIDLSESRRKKRKSCLCCKSESSWCGLCSRYSALVPAKSNFSHHLSLYKAIISMPLSFSSISMDKATAIVFSETNNSIEIISDSESRIVETDAPVASASRLLFYSRSRSPILGYVNETCGSFMRKVVYLADRGGSACLCLTGGSSDSEVFEKYETVLKCAFGIFLFTSPFSGKKSVYHFKQFIQEGTISNFMALCKKG